MNQLGWHWWPSDSTIATTDYEGRGALHQPRPLHAGLRAGRQGQHRHHLLAASRSAPASSCARAAGCARSRSTRTAWPPASIYYDAEGNEQFQPAEMVIVACNGVGTPRLMLNSVSGKFPNGLANSSGLVGKNLMFHPYALTYGYVDEPLDGNHGPPLCLWSQEFYETDTKRDFVRGYTFQFSRGFGAIIEAITCTACRPPAVGRGASPRLPPAAAPSHRHVGDLRGPAGGAQPRHARSRAEGLQRHPGAEASTTRSATTAGR